MTAHPSDMPPRAPLCMPMQDFSVAPQRAEGTPTRHAPLWRIGVFAPALLTTALMIWGLYGLFETGGMTGLEYVLLSLIGATFVWVTLAVSTVTVGLVGRLDPRRSAAATAPLDVALLVPV